MRWWRRHVLYYLTAALLGLFWPSFAQALDRGELKTGTSFYAIRFRTLGEKFDLSEFYNFIKIQQNFPNYGVLEGRLAYSLVEQPANSGEPSGWRQAFGSLSLRDFRLGRGSLNLVAGDSFLLQSELPLHFSNFFYPQVYFRGLSATYSHPYAQVAVLGGGVTRSVGLLGESFRPMGETLYGMQFRSHPVKRWFIEGALYSTQDEKDFSGNLLTRNNQVYRLGTQVRTWRQLFLLGEFMQSFSENPAGRRQADVAFRAGPIWQGERLKLEANYRYIGPNFHLINQVYLPDQDVKGYYLGGDFSPWPFFGVFGNYSSGMNNIQADPSRSISDTETKALGLRLYRQPWPGFYARYSESLLATRSDFPVAVRGQTRTLYSELSKNFKYLTPYARYEFLQFKDEINPGSSYRKLSPILGVRGSREKFSWYVEGEYDRFSPASLGAGFDGPFLKVGGSYNINPKLSVYGEVSFRPTSQRFGGQLGANWKLPHGFQLQAFARYEKGTIGVGDVANYFNTNQVSLQLTKLFTWGKKEMAGMRPGEEWMGSGSIEGWVFNDANLNGALDQGEKGVEGVQIKLEDGSTVNTDSKGHYQFPAVGAGKHVVNLDAKRIPASHTFEGSETVSVEVKRRTGARVDFSFVQGATLKGRVLVSRKAGGKASAEPQGLADVLVLLKPGDLNTYTDSEGYFSFDGIIPKNYEITLHPETLPEYGEASPKNLNVALKPGDKVQGVTFTVIPKERSVIFN